MLSNLTDLPEDYACLEMIDFQKGSSFLPDIEALLQSVYDFTDEYNKDFNIDPETGAADAKEARDKHAAIKKFIVKDVGPKLKALVKKHTNIDIVGVVSDAPVNNNTVGSIYCWLTNMDDVTAQMIMAAEGITDTEISSTIEAVQKNIDISKSIDRATGKMMKSVDHWKVKIGIPVSMFTYSDFLPSNMLRLQPTAEELAAAIGHEIGHIYAFAYYLANLSFTAGRFSNNIISETDNLVKEDPKKAVKLLKKLSNDKSLGTSKNAKMMSRLVDKLTKVEESAYQESFILQMLLKFFLNAMITGFFPHMAVISVILSDDASWPTRSSSDSMNSSSFYDNDQNIVLYERSADNLVAKFGYSRQLNSMLIKLDKTFRHLTAMGTVPGRFNKKIRNSYFLRANALMMNTPSHVLLKMTNIVFGNFSSYETDNKRLKRNIQNVRDNLSDSSIPPKVKAEFIADIDEMTAQIKRNNFRVMVVLDKVSRFVILLAPKLITGSIRTVLSSGDVSRTYNAFHEEAEKLLSNRGKEISTRIRNLISGR